MHLRTAFITGACDSCYSSTLIILTHATVRTNSAVSCLAIGLTDIVTQKKSQIVSEGKLNVRR